MSRRIHGIDIAPHFRAMVSMDRSRVEIDAGGATLPALLDTPDAPHGVVVLLQPAELAAFGPWDLKLYDRLRQQGVATLAVGLMESAEYAVEDVALSLRFDVGRLSSRTIKVIDWVTAALASAATVAVFAKDTAAAAAIVAAGQRSRHVTAVVSVDGRPDLAVHALPRLGAPTLLLVQEDDEIALHFNQIASDRMPGPHELHVAARSGGVEQLAIDWCLRHSGAARTECHGEAKRRAAPVVLTEPTF